MQSYTWILNVEKCFKMHRLKALLLVVISIALSRNTKATPSSHIEMENIGHHSVLCQ